VLIRTVLVILSVIAAPAAALAQTVRLALAFERPTVMAGEPVIAHVAITNIGDAPAILPQALEPQYERLRFLIQPPGAGTEREFRPWARLENDRTQTLAPGASASVAAKIFYGASGWTFPRAGVYQVRATFGEVSSPVATLTVQEAPDAERTASRALLESNEAGLFLLLEGGDQLTTGTAVLRQVAAGSGTLSGYANYALGASQSRRFANLSTGQVRAPNPAAAQQLLQRSRTLLPAQSLYFQQQSKEHLRQVLQLQGNAAAANRLQQRFQQNLKDTVLKQNLAFPIREFAEGLAK
jgi:hypothetical protein